MEQSFIAYIENSIKNNWDLDALTDIKVQLYSIKT
jgi:long-chain acyl-CoA synthetase